MSSGRLVSTDNTGAIAVTVQDESIPIQSEQARIGDDCATRRELFYSLLATLVVLGSTDDALSPGGYQDDTYQDFLLAIALGIVIGAVYNLAARAWRTTPQTKLDVLMDTLLTGANTGLAKILEDKLNSGYLYLGCLTPLAVLAPSIQRCIPKVSTSMHNVWNSCLRRVGQARTLQSAELTEPMLGSPTRRLE